MISLIPKIFFYNSFYYFGWPKIGPLNVTIGLTYHCNSRCRTCNIWRRKGVKELGLNEYEIIFKNFGRSVDEIILTGGEPFLKKEIVQLCQLVGKYLKPRVIIIPTNGILFEVIPQKVAEILNSLPKAKIVVNLSLDGLAAKHDEIRGVPGNFARAVKTFNGLKELKNERLDLKIHTVISRFNVGEIANIYQYVQENFGVPLITEMAESRAELGTTDSDIAPAPTDYIRTIDFLIKEIKKQKFFGLDRITQAFRIEYYQSVKKILLNKKRVIPCLAGVASAQITPDGEVWACCLRAESLGNLRENNYDFKKIWRSQQADKVRKAIKERRCYCPLANVAYSNMLCHLPTLLKVVFRLLIFR